MKKKTHELSNRLERLTPEQKQSHTVKEIKKEIEEFNVLSNEGLTAINNLKIARRKIRKRVSIEMVLSVILSYLIAGLPLSLVEMTGTIREIFRSTWIVVMVIAIDSLLYFLPAYFATKCSRKQYENGNAVNGIMELIHSEIPDFPFEYLIKNGIKSILSDINLKLAAIQIITVTTLLLFIMSATGTATAEQKRSFPIYTDESASYAIVYVSGSTMFMEEATMQEGTIIIDTTKQRIVAEDDISYEIKVFDNVTTIRIEDEQKFDQSTLSLKGIIPASIR